MNLKYKYIVFDFDDTLFDYNKSEEFALKNALNAIGIEYSQELLQKYRFINRKLWDEFPVQNKGVEAFYKYRVKVFLEQIGRSSGEELFFKIYNETITTPFLVNHAETVVETLSKFCKVYIASNGPFNVRHEKLKRTRLIEFINGFISAEKIQASKPNREFYSKVMEHIGSQNTDEVLFVGDSYRSDVIGAKNNGFDVCFLGDEATIEANIKPDYLIKNLIDLISIVIKPSDEAFEGTDDFELCVKNVFPDAYCIERGLRGKSTYVYEAISNGNSFVFKFPRTQYSTHTMISEFQNSVCLSKKLPIAIPEIKISHFNSKIFGYYPKIPGISLSDALERNIQIDYAKLTNQIATLINCIALVPVDDMPQNIELKSETMKRFISDFSCELSIVPLQQIESGELVLIHGDLHRSNVIVDDRGNLTGMLDLATCSIGAKVFDVAGFIFSMEKYSALFEPEILKAFENMGITFSKTAIRNIIAYLDDVINNHYLPYIKKYT